MEFRQLWPAVALLVGCGSSVAEQPGSQSARPLATDQQVSASAAATSPQPVTLPLTAPPVSEIAARIDGRVREYAVMRAPQSTGWRRVQEKLAVELTTLGFETSRVAFEPKGVNVIGVRKGSRDDGGLVVLSAHYDHIEGCLGADDNASGLAVALATAELLATRIHDRTLMVAFWDREEEGLLGSAAHARELRRQNRKVVAMLSLDGVGFASSKPGSQRAPEALGVVLPEMVELLERNGRRGDFLAVMGDTDSRALIEAFEQHGRSFGLPVMGAALNKLSRIVLNDVARSDHASFWLNGYPGILLTDTANFRNPNYHCAVGQDSPESLDPVFMAKVALTSAEALATVLRRPE